ncbi:lysophospholipid acyltransferase family protein [bacterium]
MSAAPDDILTDSPETVPGVDGELIEKFVSLLGVPYDHYFKVTTTGQENLPASGPAMLVGNHSGAINSPDMLMLFVAWYRHQGYDVPMHALAHDFFFRLPGLKDMLHSIGAMPASATAAAEIFRNDGFLLVYPGGERDAFKTFGSRNRIRFFGRRGFIRLAIRENVPIIPVCARGGHETLFIFTSSKKIARSLGLDKLFRMDSLPISFSIPWGIGIGPFIPYIPFPIHIRIKFGEPIGFDQFTPEDAENDAIVESCHRQIVTTMQANLDSMSERKKRRNAHS